MLVYNPREEDDMMIWWWYDMSFYQFWWFTEERKLWTIFKKFILLLEHLSWHFEVSLDSKDVSNDKINVSVKYVKLQVPAG